LHRAFAAFTYRDFKVLWFGAFASTVGTWMQKVAQSWLVLELTKSSLYLGLTTSSASCRSCSSRSSAASSRIDTIAGNCCWDRHPDGDGVHPGPARPHPSRPDLATSWRCRSPPASRRRSADRHTIPGAVARPQKDLPNAIALNSIQFNLARVFGPLLSSTTMAARRAACFGLNGLSFLVVIVALMSLTVKHLPPAERKPMMEEMKGGFAYARSEPTITALTVLASMTTFLGLPLLTFLPIFARDVFHGDVGTYSRMLAFSGAGAVIGALVVAWLGRFRHMGLTLLLVQVVSGAHRSFALSRTFWVSNLLPSLRACLLARSR
jgi:hypothetical protein